MFISLRHYYCLRKTICYVTEIISFLGKEKLPLFPAAALSLLL